MHCIAVTAHTIPCLRLEAEGATALLALHGAQVLSWIPADGRERLFLSACSRFGGEAAIRGGVPVIFPQFSERGPLHRHGFARNRSWQFVGVDDNTALLALDCNGIDPNWPHACIARLRVGLSAHQLVLSLEIGNTGTSTLAFSAALHTYLCVDDLTTATLEGLQGCDYEDSAGGGSLHRQSDYAIEFDRNALDDGIDRIYDDVVAPLTLTDGAHTLAIEQDGFGDVVVWNPGERLAASIADLAAGDWQRFVCVEAAQINQAVVLGPGQRWQGCQRLG